MPPTQIAHIRAARGVEVARQQSWADFGVEEVAYELRWVTEPGWLTIAVEAPTLCMMADEIGGRCELKAKAEQPAYGEYFGSGALTLVARGEQVTVHAAEMREARLCCFALHTTEADRLTSDNVPVLRVLRSRFMFRNERIETCAALLDRSRAQGEANSAYVRSLSTAFRAALLEIANRSDKNSEATALSGVSWDAVSRHMRYHLQEPVTIETLATVAKMSPERFGVAFRELTGMSVRQWQMDHRVRAAQRLLADNPNESLAEVAALCGFADQSHFTRAFLKVVGVTPTAWLHSRS
jgi:AraC-like DNA-binding protein